MKKFRPFFGFFCFSIGILLASIGAAIADDRAAQGNEAAQKAYRTPLAGESYRTRLFGREINAAARDRENITALALGATFFAPRLGGEDIQPLGSLYVKRRWTDLRFRGVFSIFVNEVDVSQTSGSFQVLGHLDNITIPFGVTEIAQGKEVKTSSIEWGKVDGRIGAGIRIPVAPYRTDNELQAQLFYQAGYLYSTRTSDTGPDVVLPPDTLVHGFLFRMRHDGLQRNIMELPHQGAAFGLDAELMRRNTWADANYGGVIYPADNTRDYLKISGYIFSAFRIPALTEKDRGIISCHGGFAGYGHLDRFSAFRIGGGPFPRETDDLHRLVYPGAVFNQFPATEYMIARLEYRREILFFLFLHLRGTYAWVNQDVFNDRSKRFLTDSGGAFTAAITSGAPWKSEIHVEYTYDTSILRNGAPGNAVSILYSKEF